MTNSTESRLAIRIAADHISNSTVSANFAYNRHQIGGDPIHAELAFELVLLYERIRFVNPLAQSGTLHFSRQSVVSYCLVFAGYSHVVVHYRPVVYIVQIYVVWTVFTENSFFIFFTVFHW